MPKIVIRRGYVSLYTPKRRPECPYKYATHPGWLYSRTDGDRHYLSAKGIARCYGVDWRECLIIDREKESMQALARLAFIARNERLVLLTPDYTGKYLLSECKPYGD